MASYTISDVEKRIHNFPRIQLIPLPTPFYKLENLSRELGGPEIFIKRDDLTGLAFGGNKSRKLEFIIPDVLQKKADVLITWASLQSNWCLQTAAAARKYGIKPILILFKTSELPDEFDGNLLLDYILGADIRIKEGDKGKTVGHKEALAAVEEVIHEVRQTGHTPYVVAVGGSMPMGSMDLPLGAISYVNAFQEMLEQAEALGIDVHYVIHATGSGATQAGLAVGAKALKPKTKVLGISVSDEKTSFTQEVLAIARSTERALDLETNIQEKDVFVFDGYIRDGYGIVNRDVAEVVRQVFVREGIVLDPVYTAKAMIGLIDLIQKGHFRKEDKIVFFHTGGTPALFPNKHRLVELLKNEIR
ncbi:MAG: D-cysteine desulfhydrase family protein [Candidatus Aminicenantales bacterium]